MKLYMIGGLGADQRVFQYLDLNYDTQVIHWIEPKPNEELRFYVKRLSKQINKNEEFELLGVSFGGIIAIELSKITNPKKITLISSVTSSDQLNQVYISIGRTKLLNLIPNSIIKPPKQLLGFLFSTKNKQLLEQIIGDTSPTFIRWALNSIINWSNNTNTVEVVRIHGTKDRIIPLKGEAILIKEGGHFMIVDKADEISKLINERMKYAG